MNDVKITVIITTYNLEKYIEQTFIDLKKQTFQEFEILLVDDASTDGTKSIIERWRNQFDGRISIIYLKENLGMPALVRNVALDSENIHGEFVLFLDGDDSIEIDMLETMYAMIMSSNGQADVAICAYDRIDIDTGKCIATEMSNFPQMILLPPIDDRIAFINTSPWNKLWRKTVIDDLRYPGFKVGEEVSFNLRAYQKCRSIVFTERVLIHYAVHRDSIISNTDEETIWKFADELYDLYVSMEGIYREIVGLIVFLHIGLSMTLRAADNSNINLNIFIKKIESYFKTNYDWMKKNSFLKLISLKRYGIKGLALWCAYNAYRMGLFLPMIKVYRKLRLNIKF